METFTTIETLRNALDSHRRNGKSIGFVPTMGTLHEGHLSLIRQSKEENDITVCSIFVNPIQFNNREDLEKYPRNLSSDSAMLEKEGCDFLFAPSVGEMYPEEKKHELDISFGTLENILEGKFRPGHFKGVAIVVKKLFDIVEPHRSYFGRKDYQQLLIIKELVRHFSIPVEIIPCPIVREEDGLAMSSRNLRLSITERKAAPLISQVLFMMKDRALTMNVKDLQQWGTDKLNSNPLFKVEYLEIVDKRTLQSLPDWNEKENGMVCAAVYLGDVRLIDNLELF